VRTAHDAKSLSLSTLVSSAAGLCHATTAWPQESRVTAQAAGMSLGPRTSMESAGKPELHTAQSREVTHGACLFIAGYPRAQHAARVDRLTIRYERGAPWP
jgi:hypothetical protein